MINGIEDKELCIVPTALKASLDFAPEVSDDQCEKTRKEKGMARSLLLFFVEFFVYATLSQKRLKMVNLVFSVEFA